MGAIRDDREAILQEVLPGVRLEGGAWSFQTGATDRTGRSAPFAEAVRKLAERGEIRTPMDELYAVPPPTVGQPLLLLERAAIPWFGVGATGVHLNGFVRRDGAIWMWIATRSRTKASFPGHLDNLVAGGQPAALGVFENLLKECAEEALIPRRLAQGARSVGLISYCCEHDSGLKPDVMHCYDLELPEDFVPEAADGEVERFELMPLEEVARIVRETDRFKFNCSLVIIDFLVRHGHVGPTHEDWLAIVRGLREAPWPAIAGFPAREGHS